MNAREQREEKAKHEMVVSEKSAVLHYLARIKK
jgi:hypothetical protein